MNVTYHGGSAGSKVTLTEEKTGSITLIHLTVELPRPVSPEKLTLKWKYPSIGICSVWHPNALFRRHLPPNWSRQICNSRLASGAPVLSAISKNGNNVITVALSDADTATSIYCGVDEADSTVDFAVELFCQPISPIERYDAVIRIDTGAIPFYEALQNVEKWWSDVCGYKEATVPDAARLPMDSLWYSFHRDLDTEAVLRECREAKALGMDTVIIDDGWQTDNNNGDYAYCGDWEVSKAKIPDMAAWVEAIHKIGMKVMLWFSVPYVGAYAKSLERFKGMYLGAVRQNTTYCLDPRYPEVRKYLIETYRNSVINYGLDGLKLDFIDSFTLTPEAMKEDERRDYSSLEDAIDRLLSDVTETLKAIRPDILIEFRQSYIGPRIRKYGNMLRVADCPNDLIRNRVSSIDLRLISGGSAVHSDMIMWHPEESVEYASHQLLGIAFAVPQISLRLENYPEEHKKLLKYYLSFWREHRATLLDGKLTAMNPEDNYSLVSAQLDGEQIAVRYAAVPFRLKGNTEKAFFFNASADTLTVITSETELCGREYIIRDNLGRTVSADRFGTGTNAMISVPVTGSIEIR